MTNDEVLVELDEVRESELHCPVCGELMRVEVKRPVTVDICPDHGIWLDRGELDAITMQARAQGRRGARGSIGRARKAGRRDGKMAGMTFGWWSLLFD